MSPTKGDFAPPFSAATVLRHEAERREHYINDALSKEEDYYNELQTYRKQHADLCFGEDLAPEQILTAPIYREPTKPTITLPPTKLDDDYLYSGVYRINDRLFPERTRPRLDDRIKADVSFMDDDGDVENRDEGPVKVSVPRSVVMPLPKMIRPHRRRSFDPSDSVDIAEHLHKGYEPYIKSSKTRLGKGAETMSLNRAVGRGYPLAGKDPITFQ
ncbi:hypothetical protein HK097_000271 [Rhizophlyctis rosea]|uniref:Uncharacterized protein n=1 Tax=Rhizophlyctis rosea TaxID=64517 RepID=A0AAD5X251_9FUNG|nr:hypothetical protein HK097_000271 [Rhizophlyctis rosea]